jgi:hypothetical protein
MKIYALLIYISLLSMLSILLIFSTALCQEDLKFVQVDAFENPQRPPAVFRHDEHNELAEIEECNVCHHLYEDGKLVEDESSEDQRCADCHGMQDVGRKPGLVEAFHTNCKSCHREKQKGPLMCGQCHLRQ